MQCSACGYLRKRLDPLPDTHCPECGAAYSGEQWLARPPLRGTYAHSRAETRPTPRSSVALVPGLVFVVLGILVLYFMFAPDKDATVTPQRLTGVITQSGSQAGMTQPKVVMYATSWCPYCAKARAFFKRHGIAYTEYDVEREPDRDAQYKAMGGHGVPFIVVGEDAVRGFNEPALRRLLEPWFKGNT